MSTIDFFKEITAIPRESGNEDKIAEYLCDFAKKRNLEYFKDKYNNVLIKKKTKNSKPIILQAHMDMVCEKEKNYDFDFKKDKIQLIIENGYIKANKTTLGADNGIGIAQILNILNSNMPVNIEAVFTVSEETSMIGAMNFDASLLKGKVLLSLDGFEEKTIINESACFYDLIIKSNFTYQEESNKFYRLSLTGLLGGHSGFDINKNKGNSIILLASLMHKIGNFKLVNFFGGTKFNVIPNDATCEFYSPLSLEEINHICYKFIKTCKHHNLNFELNLIKEKNKTLTKKDSSCLIDFILEFPNEVIHSYQNIPTTSANLATINLKKQEIKVGFRSSRKHEELNYLDNLKKLLKKYNFNLIVYGYQPGFENANNNLIDWLLKSSPYENTIVTPVHITVELGFFKDKIKDLEVAIISPNIQGAHTIYECVEINSIEKTDKWLIDFISNYN